MIRAVAVPGHRTNADVVRLLVVLCTAAAVWSVALWSGAAMWLAVAGALLVVLLGLARIRGRSAVSSAATFLRLRRGSVEPRGVVRDFLPADGRPVGLRWEDRFVTAVVEVVPSADRMTRIGRDTATTDAVLPLEGLAACLRRHDVVLDGIDIVLYGRRLRDSTPAGQVYEQLVGPLPAAADRVVWLVVRLDATSCLDAIARRGGGSDGTARTVVAAARRVLRVLGDAGCTARILAARDLDRITRLVSHGAVLPEIGESRTAVTLPAGVNTGGSFDPHRIDRASTTAVWSCPALSSTLTVRLRPGDHGSVLVGALARFTTRSRENATVPGLRGERLRHRDSFIAGLPLGISGLENIAPLRRMDADALGELALPSSGCGQLVGSDDAGRAVTARLSGPGVRTVYLAAELYLAQQVVFRSVAVGARVVVHTDRPGAWRPLLGTAAGPDRLRLAGEFAGDRDFDTVVFDGVRPSTVPPHATAVHVHLHPDQWPRDTPTVSLLQPGAAGDRVVLTVGTRRTLLTLVTIGPETTHLGRARAAEVAPAR